jgi:myo-inositol-1(or 4)-monophosphatase
MDRDIVKIAQELSVRAIRKAGQVARERYDKMNVVQEKDQFGDVVTEVDFLAEEMILNEINEVFPEHKVHSEEQGDNGNVSEWTWLVDPLDGTNNYAIGLPVFAASIALLHHNEPVLGVIYEPLVDRLYSAVKNEGAYCNGVRIQMKHRAELKRGTIGWIQGHAVQNDERAAHLRRYLDMSSKRMMRLWAPTLQWCMLARGDIDGIIIYNSEGDDLYSGILMVKEAGGIVIDYEGVPFNGTHEEPYLIACHPQHREYYLNLVQEGLHR